MSIVLPDENSEWDSFVASILLYFKVQVKASRNYFKALPKALIPPLNGSNFVPWGSLGFTEV